MYMKEWMGWVAGFVLVALQVLLILGPIITHVVWCIQTADETGSAIALLIVGLPFPPLGWVHGVSIILGYGWL